MANCRWGPTDVPINAEKKYKNVRGTGTLPPEVHFQVSKKIAQLTKVIYTLNGRLDEQESISESLKAAYEERLQKLLTETRAKIAQYKAKASASNELQEMKNQLESRLAQEKKVNSELQEALRIANEETIKLRNGEPPVYCNSCCSLPNGVYLKKLKKEFEFVKPGRKKEEELEIIERILKKKSNGKKSDQSLGTPTINRRQSMVDIPEKDTHRDQECKTPCDWPQSHPTVSCDSHQQKNQEYLETDFMNGVTRTKSNEFGSDNGETGQASDLSTDLNCTSKPGCSTRTENNYRTEQCDARCSGKCVNISEQREKDLQARIAENQKENLRLQVDLK